MKNLLKMCSGVRHRLHVLLSVDQKTHTDRVRHVALFANWKSLVRSVCVCAGAWGWCALSSLSSLDTLVCCPSSLFSVKLPTKEAQKRVTTTTTKKRSIHEASTPDVLSGGPPWSGLYGPVLWLILFINLAARSWKEMFRDNLCT